LVEIKKERRKMKKRILKIIAGLSLTVLALTVFTEIWGPAYADGPRTLVGTWDVTVTPRDCTTGNSVPFPPPFSAVQTYNLGGTMMENDSGIPGDVRKHVGGHGVWTNTGGREYSLAWRVFHFNPDGTPAGKDVIRDVIRLGSGGDTYTSAGTVEVYNPAGILVFTGCATTTATRFE